MYLYFKALFSSLIYGIIGFLITLTFILLNESISYSITHQNNSEQLSFTGIFFYLFKNTLTGKEIMLCVYGAVFMLFVGLLKNYEKNTRVF